MRVLNWVSRGTALRLTQDLHDYTPKDLCIERHVCLGFNFDVQLTYILTVMPGNHLRR